MDAAVLRDRLPEATQKPLFGPATALFSAGILRARKCLQKHFSDAVTVRTAFQGFCGVTSLRGGQQQFATQTLRVHLLEPFVFLAFFPLFYGKNCSLAGFK